MKTVSNKVLTLVGEFYANRNCRADLWISDCDVTADERKEFLFIVMTDTWQKAFALQTPQYQEKRLRELLTWDKPRNGDVIEHPAKVRALQNLLQR